MTKKLDRLSPSSLSSNPRASLPSWLKYQPLVLDAFNAHPKTYAYVPTSLSPSTVCSRVRDAIRGALAFSYPSTIPLLDLERWYSEIVVKNDKTTVYFGTPKAILAVLQGTAVLSTESRYIYDTLDPMEITAFEILMSSGRLSGPVLIKSPPDLTSLPSRSNVERLVRPDGALVLL